MEKQANSRLCFVCGVNNQYGLTMKFYDNGPGEVTAGITVPKQFQGYPGIVHGGVIAAMLDEVTGRVFMQGNAPRFMVTAQLNVRFRKPVLVGQPLILKGYAVKDTGRIAFAKGEILGERDEVLAEAEITMIDIPGHLKEQFKMDPEDWMVYPEEA